MANFGYARVSTESQNLERQIQALEDYGVDEIVTEKKSGKNLIDRPKINELLDKLHGHDTLVIDSLDRLSRNYDEIKDVVSRLKENGASLKVLDNDTLSIDSQDSKDKLVFDIMLTVLSFVAENEREKILERQRAGIKKAKENGVYSGRKTAYSPNGKKSKTYYKIIEELEKETPIKRISDVLQVSRPTIYSIREDMKKERVM